MSLAGAGGGGGGAEGGGVSIPGRYLLKNKTNQPINQTVKLQKEITNGQIQPLSTKIDIKIPVNFDKPQKEFNLGKYLQGRSKMCLY